MQSFSCKLFGPVDDNELVHRTMREACLNAGVTIRGEVSHVFEPWGLTLLFLLSESHAAFIRPAPSYVSCHTWPAEEEGKFGLVDFFSCLPDPHIDAFISVLIAAGFVVSEAVTHNR